jgi:NADH:ubiquinone oxidoreductase subunit B-like Fe-S oxidoreductase
MNKKRAILLIICGAVFVAMAVHFFIQDWSEIMSDPKHAQASQAACAVSAGIFAIAASIDQCASILGIIAVGVAIALFIAFKTKKANTTNL